MLSGRSIQMLYVISKKQKALKSKSDLKLGEIEILFRIPAEIDKLEHTSVVVFDGKNANQISVAEYAQVVEVMKSLK
ncbi:hypothetical protein H8R26_02085 [Flavobacterium sp. F-400]|uniref:Uncharacterized protein n=2 Tax=Flavobacterium turcicum TaxID=2764718 RepID=A0ABR7JCH1_9FLAO|nr:hypothetical protein [Flavobacterium turcicum]